MRLSLAATLALCAASAAVTPALADGMPRPPAPQVAPYAYPAPEQLYYNWSGVYVGGHIGAFTASDRATFNSGTPTAFSAQDASFAGGGHAGLQFQLRDFVFGAEYSYTSLAATVGTIVSTYNVSTKLKDLQMVSGKLGYAYQNYLLYGKGGWATSGLDFTADNGTASKSSGRGNGWMAGIGVSYAIAPKIIIGAEYDYVRINADSTTLGANTLYGNNIDAQMATVRLDFKFGP